MHFNITIPKTDFPQVYAEMMHVLAAALRDVGETVTEAADTFRHDAYNIIFVPWALDKPGNEALLATAEANPERTILFNLEQAHPASPVFEERIVNLMRRTFNLDYYHEHVQELKDMGCASAPIRLLWHPSAVRQLRSPSEKNIDILFVGWVSPRRATIIKDIEDQTGLKVTIAYHMFGEVLEDMLARSKIVLNICGMEAKSFEIMRCYPAVLNGAVVVSENHHRNVYPEAKDFTYFTATETLPAVCLDFIQHPEKLQTEQQRQYTGLSQTSVLDETKRFIELFKVWIQSDKDKRSPTPKPFSRISIGKKPVEGWRYDTLYIEDFLTTEQCNTPLDILSLRKAIPAPFSLDHTIQEIETRDTLARNEAPTAHLLAWANALVAGGRITASLPYYLAPESFDFGIYLRQFSEKSFTSLLGKEGSLKLTNGGWLEMVQQSFLPTAFGTKIYDESKNFDTFLRTPNAVSKVNFVFSRAS